MLNNELNKNPFTVPESYFDRLPMQVQERYLAKNAKENSGIWATAIKPRLAYAAGVGVLALLAYGGFTLNGNNNIKNSDTYASKGYAKPISANSFVNSNSKSYAHFTSQSPIILGNTDNKNNAKSNGVDEAVIDYLAIENINVDDLLGF